jgi:hypothetical protein
MPSCLAQIAAQVQSVKDELREQGALSVYQYAHITATLDEVVEAGRRLGRKDWFMVVITLVQGIGIASIVTPDVAKHILTMVLSGLLHLFTNPPPPIGG